MIPNTWFRDFIYFFLLLLLSRCVLLNCYSTPYSGRASDLVKDPPPIGREIEKRGWQRSHLARPGPRWSRFVLPSSVPSPTTTHPRIL